MERSRLFEELPTSLSGSSAKLDRETEIGDIEKIGEKSVQQRDTAKVHKTLHCCQPTFKGKL